MLGDETGRDCERPAGSETDSTMIPDGTNDLLVVPPARGEAFVTDVSGLCGLAGLGDTTALTGDPIPRRIRSLITVSSCTFIEKRGISIGISDTTACRCCYYSCRRSITTSTSRDYSKEPRFKCS